MKSLARSRPARIGIAVCAVVVFSFYLYAVLIIWRADWLQSKRDKGSLQASARLQPWDAQAHWLLGKYLLLVDQDSAAALVSLHRAVELDPHEARHWLDLAAAYYMNGNPDQSRRVLEHALRMEPTSPRIAWEAANFYLAQNDIPSALPLFQVAIEYDASTIDAALDLCWRATKDINWIVSRALPPQPVAYFALLKLLINQNQTVPANELWHLLIEQKLKFPASDAFPYFDYLVKTQQIDQARRVWADLHTSNSALADDWPSNLVRNGGFEADFLNGGFDWRKDKISEVEISQDSTQPHTGSKALRIDFMGPNLADVGFYEYIPVQPNTPYRLGAFVKTQEIDTASGPRLAVEDFPSARILASTDEFLDTSDWRKQSIEFVTGPDTHLVMLRVVRVPGDRLIKGTLWLDDVELVPTSALALQTEHNDR